MLLAASIAGVVLGGLLAAASRQTGAAVPQQIKRAAGGWGGLAGIGAGMFAILLAGSGLLPGFTGHAPLGGMALLLHVGFGGFFLGLLVLFALLRAERHASAPLSVARKFSFWTLVVCGLVSGGTIWLSMQPILPSADLTCLLQLHAATTPPALMAVTALALAR